MSRKFVSLLFASLLLGAASWIDGVEDLPLMPALTRSSTPPVLFDKPAGRIVQASAEGDVEASDVKRFYETSLPQLGWTQAAPLVWVRGGEKLTIDLTATGKRTYVRFTVAPDRKAGERE